MCGAKASYGCSLPLTSQLYENLEPSSKISTDSLKAFNDDSDTYIWYNPSFNISTAIKGSSYFWIYY